MLSYRLISPSVEPMFTISKSSENISGALQKNVTSYIIDFDISPVDISEFHEAQATCFSVKPLLECTSYIFHISNYTSILMICFLILFFTYALTQPYSVWHDERESVPYSRIYFHKSLDPMLSVIFWTYLAIVCDTVCLPTNEDKK